MPPVEEQEEIVRRVKTLLSLADKIESRLKTATVRNNKLTEATLNKAFPGGLVPTEAELARREERNYESALDLLFRITAARRMVNGRGKKPQRLGSALKRFRLRLPNESFATKCMLVWLGRGKESRDDRRDLRYAKLMVI